MECVLRFTDVAADGEGRTHSFALEGGTLAALITSRQEESDLLVRWLLGLARPACGFVQLFGADAGRAGEQALVEVRRSCAVVYPGGGILSNLNVWDNLVLPLEYHLRLPAHEVQARGRAALDRVGFTAGLGALPAQLSLYQRRQLGLARATLTDPRLVVYNALLSGLSSSEKGVLVAAAVAFHHERPGRSSLFLTPNGEQIADLPPERRIIGNGSPAHA